MRIDRRRALALLGFGAAATPVVARDAYSGAVTFNHGVASGDPLADRVILWTRVTPADPAAGDIAYRWTLNPIDRRAGGAKSGQGLTGPARDWTIKVDATGLDAGRAYTFEFEANGVKSPMGRTRTLPSGPTKDVVLAVASCSLYPNGYFNAYDAIAKLPRVDVVLHLGDYIYEYGGERSYGMNSAVAAERPHDPAHEILSLADYRRRHAQYKSDPHLQAAHARAPWIVVWDDHETANDSFMDGAQNHSAETEGAWVDRKARAVKVYYEWMPIREPADGGAAIHRSFQFGDLASLFMLETRITARVKQLNYESDLPEPGGPTEVAAFKVKLADPSRRMMSPAQEAWLGAGLKDSVKAGRVWQVIGNEVVMGRLMAPSLKKELGEAKFAEVLAKETDNGRTRIARLERLASLDLPYGLDMWDGYPAARERLYGLVKDAQAHTIVLAGDSHAFWANELHDADGQRRAVEFGTTGITSPGGGDAIKSFSVGEVFASANPEVIYSEQAAKGFVLLTLTRDEAKAEMMAVSTIVSKAYETRVLKTFRAKPEAGGVSTLVET
ncbi:alkaline phosphatase D family protein [Phenylobacterium sp.]|uniref:alkaline phosphatase D family protein n=1 Tax=Phenylobacterium sp. TaxID=1871053 RepID=UPI00286A07B4|nr:alkaline phosphatase D family protein [Phenylobacterium sp.]